MVDKYLIRLNHRAIRLMSPFAYEPGSPNPQLASHDLEDFAVVARAP
jgi:hypothetical protein